MLMFWDFFFFYPNTLLFDVFIEGGKHKSGFQLRRLGPLWILCVYKCIGMLLLCINVYMLLFLNLSTFITILKNKSLEYWLTCLLACNSLSQDNKRSNISLNVFPDKYKWKLRKGQIYLCVFKQLKCFSQCSVIHSSHVLRISTPKCE